MLSDLADQRDPRNRQPEHHETNARRPQPELTWSPRGYGYCDAAGDNCRHEPPARPSLPRDRLGRGCALHGRSLRTRCMSFRAPTQMDTVMIARKKLATAGPKGTTLAANPAISATAAANPMEDQSLVRLDFTATPSSMTPSGPER